MSKYGVELIGLIGIMRGAWDRHPTRRPGYLDCDAVFGLHASLISDWI